MSVDDTVPSVLDTAGLLRWCRLTAAALASAEADLNRINVFPVRDSDTGTNLLATMSAASGAGEDDDPHTVLTRWAGAALAAARGNSGTLVAQWLAAWPGATTGSWDAYAVATAMRAGARSARAALARPVEGTLLTVADAAAHAATAVADARLPLTVTVAAGVQAATDALAATSSRLPELAEAGVVDAGGQGLLLLLRALLEALTPAALEDGPAPAPEIAVPSGARRHEVQFTVHLDSSGAAVGLRAALDRLGDSVVVAGSVPGPHSVHVHTDDVGGAVQAGFEAGRPHGLSIEALPSYDLASSAPVAISATSDGKGRSAVVYLTPSQPLAVAMAEEGAHAAVWGEADDAPDPAAVLAVVLGAGASRIALLPNDRRARPVADAVALAAGERGVEVAVVPSRSVMQGLAALAVHTGERPFAEDVIAMTDAAAATRTAEVTVAESVAMTYAGRCEAGDLLGLIDGEVVGIGTDLSEVAIDLVARLIAAGGELVTVLVGEGGAEAGRAVDRFVRTRHPLVEISLLPVGQSSPLLIGVE